MEASATGDDRPATRLATRLSFLAAGFAMACWAPLVPYAKARLGLDEGTLGLVLLCLGIGSIAAMPVAGTLVGRWGARGVILVAGLGLCLSLPFLATVPTMPTLCAALLLFGASLGATDVAMNVHAVAVERAARVPLMSGFHGLFSVGGLVGAAAMTGLLAMGTTPGVASLAASAAVVLALAVAVPRLLPGTAGGDDGHRFVRPHGMVLLLGALAFVAFLAEGAVLDWAALFLTQVRGLDTAYGGVGYVLFSATMTIGRLGGDRVVARLGARRVLLWGGALAVAGLAATALVPHAGAALVGLTLLGVGASNLVPILFSAAGSQRAMPAGLAVAAMTTLGYAGILTGPAAIGFVAQGVGLPAAFALLAVLVSGIPLLARRVTATP